MAFSRQVLYIWVFLMFAKMGHAQNAEPIFKDLQLTDGLSNNKVNCILQDQRGFLWFGTEDGLNRYDGKYFERFKNETGDTSGISGNKIAVLFEDKSGVLWIGTSDGGLTKYNYHLSASQQFRQFNPIAGDPNSLPENGVGKIAEDRSGYLWIATGSSHIVRFNKKTEKFDIPIKDIGPATSAFWMGDNDTLWIGRAGGGFYKINTRTLQLSEKTGRQLITTLFEDSGHDQWYSSSDRQLYRHADVISGAPPDEIVSFAEDHQMQIWMAGQYSGVSVYNKLTHEWKNYRNTFLKKGSLASDHANAVYVDRQGIVWIGTNNGLSILNPLFYPFVQHFLPKTGKDIAVYDFYKDARHRLWIATSDGLYIQSPENQGFEHRSIVYNGQELSVYKLYIDRDSSFYLGTDHSLFKYDAKANRIASLPDPTADPRIRRLIDSKIVSIVKDTINKHPVILVSPSGHNFTYYDLVEKKWISMTDSAKGDARPFNTGNNEIRKLYKDCRGDIWLATNKLGLGYRSQQNTAPIEYRHYDLKDRASISSNDVYDIQEDGKGNFWVSTYGGGLNYYDKSSRKFSHIAESTDLTEGLQLDPTGNVWMICNGHLHKYEPATRTYSCYDLPDLQLSEGIRGYVYKDYQNVMYAGGDNYYITFNPENVSRINSEPTIYLTDFKIFNSSHSELLEKKSIELDHSQNYFSFEYSAPEFNGDNIQYAYMLEGIDKDWITAGKRNFVSYSNLPAGKYLFKVRASNWEGNQFTKFTSVAISIRPPFWATWWFYASVVLILFSVCYFFYRFRINELLKRQAIRNGIAQDLHDQIGATLGSISVYAGVAKLYQQQDNNEKLKNVLHTIEKTAAETISEMGDLVWAVNPRNDNIGSIIQRIESYAQPLCVAKNIGLHIHANPRLLSITPSMLIRKNVFLMLKELINNAIRHAECKNITLEIVLRQSILELNISDDGIGFDMAVVSARRPASMSGNGLPNIRRRAKEMKGEIIVHSERSNGTKIRIKLAI
ncbi:MAG TPA: two-component regulator propeller domain-containing protein [Puia sp.]|nr:two-component regulator propeller domain-containing protein [Puia sp.]